METGVDSWQFKWDKHSHSLFSKLQSILGDHRLTFQAKTIVVTGGLHRHPLSAHFQHSGTPYTCSSVDMMPSNLQVQSKSPHASSSFSSLACINSIIPYRAQTLDFWETKLLAAPSNPFCMWFLCHLQNYTHAKLFFWKGQGHCFIGL